MVHGINVIMFTYILYILSHNQPNALNVGKCAIHAWFDYCHTIPIGVWFQVNTLREESGRVNCPVFFLVINDNRLNML